MPKAAKSPSGELPSPSTARMRRSSSMLPSSPVSSARLYWRRFRRVATSTVAMLVLLFVLVGMTLFWVNPGEAGDGNGAPNMPRKPQGSWGFPRSDGVPSDGDSGGGGVSRVSRQGPPTPPPWRRTVPPMRAGAAPAVIRAEDLARVTDPPTTRPTVVYTAPPPTQAAQATAPPPTTVPPTAQPKDDQLEYADTVDLETDRAVRTSPPPRFVLDAPERDVAIGVPGNVRTPPLRTLIEMSSWRYSEPDHRQLFPGPVTLKNGYVMNNMPPLQRLPLWPVSDTPADAAGYVFANDPRRARLCTFEHVCLNGTHVFFPLEDVDDRMELQRILSLCALSKAQLEGRERPPICTCFMKGTDPAIVSPHDLTTVALEAGHHWLLDTYVNGHQIGHWAESLALFHAIHLQASSYGLPPVRRLIFNKVDPPLSDHERFFYDISIKALPYPIESPIWASQITGRRNMRCFAKLSTSSITAVTATNSADGAVYRLHAYEALNREVQTCPPADTVLLYRNKMAANRRMLNENAVIDLLVNKYGITRLRHVTVGAQNSSAEQSRLFAETGFFLSSHSSQLINLLFTQPGAAVIEISPAYYNNDFYQLAKVMDIHHQFVLGGTADGVPLDPTAVSCHEEFVKCAGMDSDCVIQRIWKTEKRCVRAGDKLYDTYAKNVKHRNFYANLEWLERAIQSAISHLHRQCAAEGGWAGSTWRQH